MAADGRMTLWMRLRGMREVAAGLRSTAAQTEFLGRSVDRLARHMDRASRRTFLMNQALFTLRRYSYMATLALTASAAAVIKWGFDYNTQVQAARVAFIQFGLTNRQVNKEIKTLYRLAAISPFLFTDITNTARRFLAFGMDLGTTNRLVRNLTDSLTALGLANTASMNRASLALAHLWSVGRVTGQIVYQLARDNVPIIQALEQAFHLTGDQIRQVGRLGIPASAAIKALNQYIEQTPRFHGAALKFALSTWTGIVTTTRDYIAQFMGEIERPLFLNLQGGIRNFLLWLQRGDVQKAARRGDIAGVLAVWNPNVARGWRVLQMAMSSAWRILVEAVIPAFQTVAHYMFPVLFILATTLAHGLNFLSKHTFLLKLFFGLLALELGILAARFLILIPLQTILMGRMIIMNTLQRIAIALGIIRIGVIDAETGAIVFNSAAEGRRVIVLTWLGRAMKLNILWTKLSTFFTRLWTVAIYGNIRGQRGQFVAMTRVEKGALRLRRAMMPAILATRAYTLALWGAVRAGVAFLFTNPIGWAILAVGIFLLLYWRVRRFREIVNSIFHTLWNGSPIAKAALMSLLGPLGTIIVGLRVTWTLLQKVYNAYRRIRGVFGTSGGYTGSHGLIGNWLSAQGVPTWLTGAHRVEGGTTANIGGQNAAARVTTGSREGMPDFNLPILIELQNKNELTLDSKKVAESVSNHRLTAKARR